MALLWTMTAGLVISLGLVGFMLVHFLKEALHADDSRTVDKIQKNE